MPDIDLTLNPVSILAFVLTCLGCVQTLAAIFLTSWWSFVYNNGKATYYGVWSMEDCSSKGDCQAGSATALEGGEEVVFVSKVFATFTGFLALLAVVLHVLYVLCRKALVRTLAIFLLGAAGLFGMLSVFCFLGYYHNQASVPFGEHSLGAAFYLCLVGSIFCFLAAACTAWAAVRKVTGFGASEMED